MLENQVERNRKLSEEIAKKTKEFEEKGGKINYVDSCYKVEDVIDIKNKVLKALGQNKTTLQISKELNVSYTYIVALKGMLASKAKTDKK